MTRDVDVVVLVDDAIRAFAALRAAGFRATTPTGPADDPESMVIFVDAATGVELYLLVASGDPEASVIDAARRGRVFGVTARIATLEELLLLYLYSNQPKHLGDFAAIAQSGKADLALAERRLRAMHPEMLATWRRRVKDALYPPPAPPRPPPRRTRRSTRPRRERRRGPSTRRTGGRVARARRAHEGLRGARRASGTR